MNNPNKPNPHSKTYLLGQKQALITLLNMPVKSYSNEQIHIMLHKVNQELDNLTSKQLRLKNL